MNPTVEPVIAGSRGFALALLAPLTERIGTRPRIAAGAAQARPLCTGPGGLVVVEFVGAETLREIEALVRDAKGIRVVAAVPEAHAAAGASLRALGVEVARWDGTPAAVIGAVGRQLDLAASAAIAPSPSRPPARPPAPPQPQARPPVAAPAPARPPSAAPAPPRAPSVAAGPILTPAPARASSAAAGPILTPAPARAPSAPAAPILTPAPARARPAPPAGAAPVAAPPISAPPVSAAPVSAAPPPGPGRPPAAAAPAAMPAFTPAPGGVPWKIDAPPSWPASVPGAPEAASALRAALSGSSREGPSVPGLDGVLPSLADVELAVLAGEPLPIEPDPIRQAAVMRVRVAAALATVPAAGQPVDGAAVSALLAEIDGLLSSVNDLAAGASEDLQPSLEAVRNALVREAIDFSEAAQRASPAGATAVAAAPQAAARISKTRMVSVDAEPERASRRGLAMWIALAALIAAAAGYHAWNWHQRSQRRAVLSAGLPAGMTQIPGPPGGARVLVRSSTPEQPDPADIARFKAAEEAAGNTVREADGMIFIEPAPREGAPAPSPRSTP